MRSRLPIDTVFQEKQGVPEKHGKYAPIRLRNCETPLPKIQEVKRMIHGSGRKRGLMSLRCWTALVMTSAMGAAGIRASSAQGAALTLWSLFASPPPISQGPRFTLTDLGTLGGSSSMASSINDLAQAAGNSLTVTGSEHAFLFSAGQMTDLGTLGGVSSEALGINNQGHVVGQSLTAGQAAQHSFLSSGGKMIDLGTLGGLSSAAAGINDVDQVVGYSFTSVLGYSPTTGIVATHAFLSTGGRMSDLGTLGGATSVGAGLNALGQAVGNSFTAANAARHAVLFSDGRRIDLGTLGGLNSFATGINALGQVVGNSFVAGNGAFQAFLSTDGKMISLNTLGGTNSSANGINTLGQVAGESDVAGGLEHAFLWQQSGIIDLNNSIPAGSGWELNRAIGISDAGEIAGGGTKNGAARAFLLTPVDAKTLTLQEAADARSAIDQLISQVNASLTNPRSVSPRVSYLISKLQAARERIGRGNVTVALNLLQSFALVAGRLTASEIPADKRQALVDDAQAIMTSLGG
jgi:probable HAF family extracellular repeat protein